MTNEAARLSRLLFQSRERDSMFIDIVESRTGKTDEAGRRLRDEIDAYRAERGWSPDGFGYEHDSAPGSSLGSTGVSNP